MIAINVEPVPGTQARGNQVFEATASAGGVDYANRSWIVASAVSGVIQMLAAACDDQELMVYFPTVSVRHASLWDLARVPPHIREQRLAAMRAVAVPEIKTPGECTVCHRPVTGRRAQCSDRCRQRASRARRSKTA